MKWLVLGVRPRQQAATANFGGREFVSRAKFTPLSLLFLTALLFFHPSPLTASTIIDLTALANADTYSGPNIFVAGQTFTAPAGDSYLTRVDFMLAGRSSGVPFRFVVAPWISLPPEPLAPYRGQLGTVLFVSGPYDLPSNSPFEDVRFDLPNLALIAGLQYAAVIDIGPYADSTSTLPVVATVARLSPADAYTGGFELAGNRIDGLLTGLTQSDQNFDVAFRADVIPEPASAVQLLVGTAVALLRRFACRRLRPRV
jgi:hypothetical protein